MNKKIIIVCVVAVLVCIGVVAFFMVNGNKADQEKNNQVETNATSETVKAGEYTLHYGTYKGLTTEYDVNEETGESVKVHGNELVVKLNSDNTYEMDNDKHKYEIVGTDIISPDYNNAVMFKVLGNDKILFEVGAGVELTYQGK